MVIWRLLRRLILSLLTFVMIGLIGLVGFYFWVNYNDNFHAVQDGVVYRSAQMSVESLEKHIEAEHFQTVVNLRGSNPNQEWYRSESKFLNAKGVQLIDIPLSSSSRVKPDQARAYIDLIANSPKPVLIHCLNGSDRTGLISAIYLMQNGIDEITASKQLAMTYGHFPFGPWADTKAMDLSLKEFISTLQPGTD